MGQVVAQITTSLDGYVAGPDDGPGRRLFEGFDKTIGLRQVSALQSPWATHLRYRVERA